MHQLCATGWNMRRKLLIFALVSPFAAQAASRASADPADAFAPAPAKGAIETSAADAEIPLSRTDLARWISELGSADFETRREATRRLIAAGREAIDAVTKGAAASDFEISARCLDVLKRLMQSGDAEAKSAAEQALKSLSEDANLSVAQRAADAVRKPEPAVERAFARIAAPPLLRVAGGVQTRESTVEKDGRKIHVKETAGPNRKIEVEITEKVGGALKTTKLQVANIAELRQKSAEAFDVYMKHVVRQPLQPWAVVGLPRAAVPVPNPAVPVGPARRFVPAAQPVAWLRVEARNENGRRKVEHENDERKLEISDENGKNIVVKETRIVDGKSVATEVKGKDLEDLKKTNPEAAEKYERYLGSAKTQTPANGIRGTMQLRRELRQLTPQLPVVPPRAIPFEAIPQLPETPKLP